MGPQFLGVGLVGELDTQIATETVKAQFRLVAA
jgi:hypothetical protein